MNVIAGDDATFPTFLTLVLKTLGRDYLIDTRAKALEISSSLGHLSKFLMRQLAAKRFLSAPRPLEAL